MKNVHTIENIFSEEEFKKIQEGGKATQYDSLYVGQGDTFHMAFSSYYLNESLYKVLEKHYNASIDPIVAFVRLNTACLDDTLRIHSDRDILGDTPSHAAVFHITDNPEVENGTAFWKHKTHGEYLPAGVNQDESEYGDISLWEFQDLAKGKENCLVTYPANRFHSRYPHQAWGEDAQDGRIIWAAFFNVEE